MNTWWKYGVTSPLMALAFGLSITSVASAKNLLLDQNDQYAIHILPKKDLVFFDAFFRSTNIQISRNSEPLHQIDFEDKIITSALLEKNSSALIAGSIGKVYRVDLESGKIQDQLDISNKTQFLLRSPLNSVFTTEGLLAIEKIHAINSERELQLIESINVENVLELKSSITSGPQKLHFFKNGNALALNRQGKILAITTDLKTKVIPTGKIKSQNSFRDLNDLVNIRSDLMLNISDDLSLTIINKNLEARQVPSPLIKNISALNESLKGEIKIADENIKTCRSIYRDTILASKKSQLMVRIMTGAVIIINPVVGIGGVLLNESDLMINWDSIDHAILTMKILDDAHHDKASVEISMLSEVLNKFDSNKFPNENLVREKINSLNQSKKVCTDKLATIKDLLLMLIQD